MTDNGQFLQAPQANCVATKRGLNVYRSNPSIPPASGMPTRPKRFELPGGKAALIVDPSSGEIKGLGGLGFWWQEEVDASRFVKLFLEGIKQAAGLSRSGLAVFELVYHQMRQNPNCDKIELSPYLAADSGFNPRTFRRGLRELLEKEFLFKSTSEGLFFINIRFMFNGNRLAFVKTYHLKDAGLQHELPLAPPDPGTPLTPSLPPPIPAGETAD